MGTLSTAWTLDLASDHAAGTRTTKRLRAASQVNLPLNVRLKLKIALADRAASSVLPATCRPSMTCQPACLDFIHAWIT